MQTGWFESADSWWQRKWVGLLDSDEEDDYLRDAGLDNTIFPGSDDELGFEEEEVDNVSDSEEEK